MRSVQVVGGGPAGSMAAFAALCEGAEVRIFEKSAFPRHKVCGEFLSPAILALLRRTGCEKEFLQLRPAILREMQLHFGARVIRHPLPEHAYGLSRYELDNLLFQCATRAGAHVVREHWSAAAQESTLILATGRKSIAPAGDRLFGFKAHFRGPLNDAVELFFFQNCYVGVSAIEDGATNVCGLAPERALHSVGFHPSELLHRCAALSDRLRALARTMEWLVTGPLVFSARPSQYSAGDSLGLIDPFTGSGILNAMPPANSLDSPPRAAPLRNNIFAIAAACFDDPSWCLRLSVQSSLPATPVCSRPWSPGDSSFTPPDQ
jgi:hypothetical protein